MSICIRCTTYSGSNCDLSMGLCIAPDGDTTAEFGDNKDSSRSGNNDRLDNISQDSMNSFEHSQEDSGDKSDNDADDESSRYVVSAKIYIIILLLI